MCQNKLFTVLLVNFINNMQFLYFPNGSVIFFCCTRYCDLRLKSVKTKCDKIDKFSPIKKKKLKTSECIKTKTKSTYK
jgi:hypothetical protein